MITINLEIVQFIRHLALTEHLTVMHKDSTNIGVNLTKGKPLFNPRINTYFVSKTEFLRIYLYMYVLFITSLLCRPPNPQSRLHNPYNLFI